MILSDNHVSRQFNWSLQIFTNSQFIFISHVFRPSWGGRQILISHIPEKKIKKFKRCGKEIPPHFRPVTGKNWTLIENWLHRKNITNEEAIPPPLPPREPPPRSRHREKSNIHLFILSFEKNNSRRLEEYKTPFLPLVKLKNGSPRVFAKFERKGGRDKSISPNTNRNFSDRVSSSGDAVCPFPPLRAELANDFLEERRLEWQLSKWNRLWRGRRWIGVQLFNRRIAAMKRRHEARPFFNRKGGKKRTSLRI